MTSKFSIDNTELLQRISSGEAVVGIDFGNLIVRELAAFRLAAMDSEPNCKERKLFCSTDTARMRKVISASAGAEATPLYRHAQQPAPEYPEVLPCPVLLDPGLRFGKGIKTSTMLAALARRAVYESDMAALSPEEIVEFQARIEDFKVLIAQPALVVPDEIKHRIGGLDWGWEGEFNRGWNACRAAMLDRQLVDHVDEESLTSINPAPAMGSLSKTGEVLHTNSPAQGGNSSVIPDTWIPVSEQMPPSRHEVLVGRWWGEKPRWCCKWATYIPGHPDAQSSGWLIPGGSWTPTHWMELPAAPQEVK
ncbi:DUF551 domain-containing protein [Klebsiella pneumoniae]